MRLNNHKISAEDSARARKLRNEASPIERKLWNLLRLEAKRTGMHFRRQHPVGVYTADFTCLKARLLIELDGQSHDATQEKDKVRDAWLEQQGFIVLRIPNDDVVKNTEGVVRTIIERAEMLLKTAN